VSVIRDVLEELFSMFMGDARLSIGVLLVVGAAAGLAYVGQFFFAGTILLLGSLGLVLGNVLYAARKNAGSAETDADQP
jgi:hypothetical protein